MEVVRELKSLVEGEMLKLLGEIGVDPR